MANPTLIRFKKNLTGDWTFSTFKFDYELRYVPDPTVRGAYSYELNRLLFSRDETIAEFATLQRAREWITSIGYIALDNDLTGPTPDHPALAIIPIPPEVELEVLAEELADAPEVEAFV
jgi:hypothetical protein